MYYNNINPTYTSSNLRSSLATNYKKNYSGRLDNFSAKKSDEDMINRRKKSEIPTRSYTIDRTLDRTDQSFNPSSIITQQLDLSPFSYSQVNRNSVNSPRTELNRSQKSSSVYPSNNNVSYGRYFLPEKSRSNLNKKTLILDLDETLVHSQFKPFYFKSDIVLNVTFERQGHVVHVMKRPYVDEFIEKMANLYELVIFTASISAYANPLIDRLDPRRLISHRLFREHCVSTSGSFIKDLKKLGRDLRDVIILDVTIYLIT